MTAPTAPPLDPTFTRTDAELAAHAAGVPVDDHEEIDFFGFITQHKHFLPDNVQYFEFKTLTEGEISELQSASNSEVTVQRVSGDAKMKVDQAKDRHNLIAKSLTGWHLKRGGQLVQFPMGSRPETNILNVIKALPPKIVADLEQAIRKENPSLVAERSVEEIDKAIESLNEEREAAVKREAGKAGS